MQLPAGAVLLDCSADEEVGLVRAIRNLLQSKREPRIQLDDREGTHAASSAAE